MRCSDYVNYPTHSQKKCALFEHEKRHENSSGENINEEMKSDEE